MSSVGGKEPRPRVLLASLARRVRVVMLLVTVAAVERARKERALLYYWNTACDRAREVCFALRGLASPLRRAHTYYVSKRRGVSYEPIFTTAGGGRGAGGEQCRR